MSDYIFFWKDSKDAPNNIFSQWFVINQTMDIVKLVNKLPFLQYWLDNVNNTNIVINSCECWMMFCKAILMKDLESAKQILNTIVPREQKKLGRAIKNFNEEEWLKWREEIVYEGNLAKFSQNIALKDEMLSLPRDKEFVESSPYDTIWGIGLLESDSKAWNKETWQGLNLLGKALDRVRNTFLQS